jgi:gliding motility-associated-like protein
MNENNGVSPIIVSNQVCYQIDKTVTMPKYIVIGENNKAINDFTFPSNTSIPEKFTMRIYDRLGTKVFETTDSQKGWNGCYNNGSGSPVPPGAYIYSLEFTGSDGKMEHQQNSFIVVHK